MIDYLMEGLAWYFVFLFSLTLHEGAHALAGYKMGDHTAYEGGQVSLDPVPHIRQEPMGTILIPIITYIMGGWMMGWASCPYDPRWALSYPKRAALMSLAGPVANLLIVIVSALFIRIGMLLGLFYPPELLNFSTIVSAYDPGFMTALAFLLSISFSLNVLLFLFNLLPLPPLDGSGILPYFMQEDTARKYMMTISNPTFMIIGLLLAWKVFGYIFSPLHLVFVNLLYPGMHYG